MRIIATLGLLGSTAAAAAPVEVTDASGTLTVHPDFASAVAAAPADATLVLTEGEHGDLTVEGGVHVFVEAADGASIDSITIGGAGTIAEFQGVSMRGSDQGIEVKGGTLVLTDSELREMGSPDGYAVRVATGASLGLVNVDVSDSKGAAGAIHAESGSSLGIVGSRFFANTGASGGAISADGAEVAIANSEFRHNSASDAGGAIAMVQGTLDLMDVEFIESDASRGGAIFVGPDATLTAEDVTFRGNAAATGGHMLVDHGTAWLTRVRLESGRAQHGVAVALLEQVGIVVSPLPLDLQRVALGVQRVVSQRQRGSLPFGRRLLLLEAAEAGDERIRMLLFVVGRLCLRRRTCWRSVHAAALQLAELVSERVEVF